LRKPLGAVGSQVLGIKAIADQEGLIIDMQEKTQLPQLLVASSSSQYKPGDRLNKMDNLALKILADVSGISGKQVLGKLNQTKLEIVFSDSTQVLFDIQYLEPNWKSTLHLILSRSKIQAKVPKTIDLRFSSPILTF